MSANQLVSVYRWVIRAVILIIPFLTLYIPSSLFFPFVTGRALVFRGLVMGLAVLWAGLMVIDKNSRPRGNWLTAAIGAMLVVTGLAAITGVDPYLSFWSRMERMDGWLNLAYLSTYFLILSSVWRERWEWEWLFESFVVVGVLQSLYALVQKLGWIESTIGGFRVEGTFGNPTFLAAWLLFTIIMTMVVWLHEKNAMMRWVWAGAGFLQLAVLYLTATRGAMLALLTGILVYSVIYLVWLGRNREGWGRKMAIGIMILVLVLPMAIWVARGTSLVRNSETLNRLASISVSDRTTQARFLVWGVAWEGFKERPWLGWGQENFAQVFNKYYDPGLYNQEQWFDRAHNVVFDWLIAAGGVGLLVWLTVLVGAGREFWRRMQSKTDYQERVREAVFLVALIVYFIQDLFVFDQFGSYLPLFTVLAYAAVRQRHETQLEGEMIKDKNINKSLMVAGLLLVLSLGVGYQTVWRPTAQARMIVAAMEKMAEGKLDAEVRAKYQEAVEFGGMGDLEALEQMAKVVNDVLDTPRGQSLPETDRKAYVQTVVRLLEDFIERDKDNLRLRLFLGSIYTRFSEMGEGYLERGFEVFKEAMELSPRKQVVYFAVAENYMKQDKGEKAFQILEKAVALQPAYGEARSNLAFLAVLLGRQEVVEEMVSVALKSSDYAKVANAYIARSDFKGAILMLEKAVAAAPGEPEFRARLAGVYLNQGRIEEAVAQAKEVKRLSPETYGPLVDQFLDNIRQMGYEVE